MKKAQCHARSKQKRQQLRLKNFRVKQLIKYAVESIAKGEENPKRSAGEIALNLKMATSNFETARRMSRMAPVGLNQRQKRKIQRQQPHGRKY